MIDILIGGVCTLGFLTLVGYSRRRKLPVRWWHWLLTSFAFLYAVFVLEMIIGFLSEGAARAALVMGLLFGFLGIFGAVLLARLVFMRRAR